MKIGKICFSEKLKSLSWVNFKKYWNDSGHEKETGLTPLEAAKMFGIKTPTSNKKGE
jgi:hypothetical protein